MNKKQFIIGLLLASVMGGLVVLAGVKFLTPEQPTETFEQKQNVWVPTANYSVDTAAFVVPEGLNFIQASDVVRPAVVYIKTFYEETTVRRDSEEEDELEDMFREYHPFDGRNPRPRESAGSGVLISADGYVATNNHVVENASRIEIIMDDKRSFEGTIVGTDPTTDLALVKINERGLPFVKYGNSDRLKVGEWVLAVGNPFDLTSTVTAGIVSAKARNINILQDENNLQVETFIQTDAAVNPGNSGGALVNLRGELVGINTAIATSSRFSQGYSFAVPVTLVRKVMDDFLKFGTVQRALLGVVIKDIDATLVRDKGLDLKRYRGVFIDEVNSESAADEAGIKSGDIITKIGDIEINSSSELQGVVATYRPGDQVALAYTRRGKEYTTQAVLKNRMGNTNIVRKPQNRLDNILGADLQALTDQERKKLSIAGGVKVVKLNPGKMKDKKIREGFIITQIEQQPMKTPADVIKAIRNNPGEAILIEGMYEDGTKYSFAIAP